MVARGPGAVGCAHCTRLGAEEACAGCGHLVCAACAADWTTCELATVKLFELEKGTKVVDVDWGGRYLLAARATKLFGVFDLRTGAWLPDPARPEHYRPLSITRAGEIVPGSLTPDNDVALYFSIVRLALSDLATGKVRVLEPLKGKVIEGVAVHGDLLAAAAWGELALFRMDEDRLELRTHHALDGEVKWCALAGSTLAVADATHVRAWNVREDGNAHESLLEVDRKRSGGHGPARAFALSRDGKFLVAGDVVYDLARRASKKLGGGHAEDIVFAKFVAEDRWLVTCDDDRNFVMRSEYR